MDTSFLEEGSPTMVEKGMDPASVFEMCDDDDDNGIHDVKESGGGATGVAEGINAGASASAAPLPSGSESSTTVRHRRRGRSVERPEPKTKRESWIDPPEERRESNMLTQAEMESCMQTYSVSGTVY